MIRLYFPCSHHTFFARVKFSLSVLLGRSYSINKCDVLNAATIYLGRILNVKLFFSTHSFLFLSGTCRQLEFDHTVDGKRLNNHVIRTVDVTCERSCRTLCYMEPNCVSYNFNRVTKKCELNNSTFREGKEKMETIPDYINCGAKVREVLTQ